MSIREQSPMWGSPRLENHGARDDSFEYHGFAKPSLKIRQRTELANWIYKKMPDTFTVLGLQ